MRQIAIGVMTLLVLPGLAWAQPTDRPAVEKKILEMERQINEAFAKDDVATFRKLVPADAMGIDPAQGLVNVDRYVQWMKELDVKPGWNMENTRFHWVGDDTVILTYRWTGQATHQGMPLPNQLYASTVWTNRKGNWQPVFHQESMAMPMKPKQ